MAAESRYYIFYIRNSYASCITLFWYVLTTKTKLSMKIRKIQHISKRPHKYLKFNLRYSMPKYSKISTLQLTIHSRWVAQYQIASGLSAGSCTNMTLHSNGTTKHGHSYTTYGKSRRQTTCLWPSGSWGS